MGDYGAAGPLKTILTKFSTASNGVVASMDTHLQNFEKERKSPPKSTQHGKPQGEEGQNQPAVLAQASAAKRDPDKEHAKDGRKRHLVRPQYGGIKMCKGHQRQKNSSWKGLRD